MSRIVQEKFQINFPEKGEGNSGWKTDKSARRKNGLGTRDSASGKYEGRTSGYNCLPPGSDIEDQEVAHIPAEAMSTGNMGNGDQATTDVTRESLRSGFDRKRMRPTDDEYTRQHNDAFYDSIEVDGIEGFVERNNVLDRI